MANDYTYTGGEGITMAGVTISLNVMGFSTSTVTGTLVADVVGGGTATYSIQSQGKNGSATINSNTGAFSYSIADLPTSATAINDRVVIAATSGSRSTTANVDIALRFDPLLPNQWHLRNTGQYAFSDTRPVAGFDINVGPAWESGFSGLGIKVGVVDDGLEIAHEDLVGNMDVGNSIDFRNGGTDTTPTAASGRSVGNHGTSVAGIIASGAFNAKGGRGIAFRARLRGYNFLTMQSQTNFSASFGGHQRSADTDVFTGSFGSTGAALPSYSQTYIDVLNQTTSLRGGRGAIVLMSAGNNFLSIDSTNTCDEANRLMVSCSSPAADAYKQSAVPLVIGALASDGKKASYSNTASSIWVSAPGGESGAEAAIAGSGGPAIAYKPAITTVNLTGCGRYNTLVNALDNPSQPIALAAQCQYTATMNGTSSAAPMVAGVVALMLEANPNLTYRDVAHILAVTARKVDPTFAGVSASLVGATRQLEAGWTTNAAGYSFSNRYGFGAVDAGKAVAMARTYTGYLPSLISFVAPPFQAGGDVSIGANGKFVTFQVNSTVTKVERVFARVNIYSRTSVGTAFGARCMQIELVSPAGTRSILLNAGNGFTNTLIDRVLLASNAFYGENPNGVWRLVVYDWCGGAPSTPTMFSLSNPQELALTGS